MCCTPCNSQIWGTAARIRRPGVKLFSRSCCWCLPVVGICCYVCVVVAAGLSPVPAISQPPESSVSSMRRSHVCSNRTYPVPPSCRPLPERRAAADEPPPCEQHGDHAELQPGRRGDRCGAERQAIRCLPGHWWHHGPAAHQPDHTRAPYNSGAGAAGEHGRQQADLCAGRMAGWRLSGGVLGGRRQLWRSACVMLLWRSVSAILLGYSTPVTWPAPCCEQIGRQTVLSPAFDKHTRLIVACLLLVYGAVSAPARWLYDMPYPAFVSILLVACAVAPLLASPSPCPSCCCPSPCIPVPCPSPHALFLPPLPPPSPALSPSCSLVTR